VNSCGGRRSTTSRDTPNARCQHRRRNNRILLRRLRAWPSRQPVREVVDSRPLLRQKKYVVINRRRSHNGQTAAAETAQTCAIERMHPGVHTDAGLVFASIHNRGRTVHVPKFTCNFVFTCHYLYLLHVT